MIFGTDGHRAAGTSAKLMPSTTIVARARNLLCVAGSAKANTKWQTIRSRAPQISIVAPFPFVSRNLPRNGVMMAAPIGNHLNMSEAVLAEIPSRLHWSMFAPYLWNGKIAE